MSETPGAESSSTSSTSSSATRAKKPKPAPAKGPAKGSASLPSVTSLAALVIALVAVVVGILGWFHPSTGPGRFNDQQSQDARQKMCEATGVVRASTQINTNLANPVEGDPVGALAVASNARLALYAGGGYLRARLAEQPATPPDLKDAVNAYADTMEHLSINYLAGAGPDSPVQAPLRDQLRGELDVLNGICQQ